MTRRIQPPDESPDSGHREHAIDKQRLNDWLDEALEATFPASDPVASPPPSAPAERVRDEQLERVPHTRPRRFNTRR